MDITWPGAGCKHSNITWSKSMRRWNIHLETASSWREKITAIRMTTDGYLGSTLVTRDNLSAPEIDWNVPNQWTILVKSRRETREIVAHCHYHDNFSQLISSHDLIISNLTDDLTNLNHCGFDWLSWYLTTLNMAASFRNCMPSKWYCVLFWCVASFRFKIQNFPPYGCGISLLEVL